MTDFVRALDTQTGQVVNLDLTPQWSPPGTRGKEQQAVTEGNAKYTGDTRMKGKPCSEIPPGFAAPKGWQGCSHGYMAPHLVWPEQTPVPAPSVPPRAYCGRTTCTLVEEHKHGKGRPKGSTNKPKQQKLIDVQQIKLTDADLEAAQREGLVNIDPVKLAAAIKALKDAGLV